MGESPDRVLRDGGSGQDRERGRTGSTAVGTAADGASADTPADTSAPVPASAAASASGDAPKAGGKAGGKGGSTVQLRVRDVDSKTTMLRLPVDNRTTALRLPDELVKPSGAGSSEADAPEAPDEASDATPEEDAKPSGKPAGADPRLGMRTTVAQPADEAGEADEATADGDAPGEDAEPTAEDDMPEDDTPDGDAPVEEVEEAVEDAAEADAPVVAVRLSKPEKPASAASAEKPEPAEKSEAAEKSGKSGDADESGPAEKAPGRVKSEKLEKPRLTPLKAAPAAGTVPEPPAPGPLPEPEPQPGPEPLPKPAPAPEPGPAPAPEPLPAPDPRPVPPVPPLPKPEPLPVPEPLPSPENTAEAMEVLAALNARPVSPLRRALKRITIWTVFLAVVLGAAVVAQLLRPLPDAKVRMSAAGSYSFPGDPLDLAWPAKGQSAAEVVGVGSLGSSGPETPASIASVTKVMNAYLILQKFPLKKGESGPKIVVDKQAAQESGNVDESKVTLTENQVLTEYQALELLMLPSANNVARLLARFHSGSEVEFVKLMNETAAKFGMANTTYADPAGYNADTKSTAKDQLKLAEQVMQDEIFRQIVSTPDTTFNNQKIPNTNNLINPKTGVIGVKTGSSTPAGGCLMWAAYKEVGGVKRLILGVTLGQQATSPNPGDGILPTVLKVSGKQIQAAQNGVTGQTVVKKGDVVGYVDNGLGGKVAVVATKDLVVAGFPGIGGTVTLDAGKVDHHAAAGTEIGTLRVGDGDSKSEVRVALQADLNPPSIQSRLTRML
ncbi:hypothetical protein ACFV4F_11300 [Kitasatospora sp. NPDC059722]|uniref:hypothetical protein n=1 Tax=Kitasatospora sp. NPDC059722 TaxID=3346925 RepID=UPI0036CF260B